MSDIKFMVAIQTIHNIFSWLSWKPRSRDQEVKMSSPTTLEGTNVKSETPEYFTKQGEYSVKFHIL